VRCRLLGAFVAGMLFCNVPHSMTVWKSEMSSINNWLVRLFFTASVGFAVPARTMFSSEGMALLWKGLIIAAVPTILCKVLWTVR
jgi:Kef-type K+ transport system membrane component KefB